MYFNKVHTERKNFIASNRLKDHVIISGKNNVLISAPHGVSQVRLGKYKSAEIGSLALALYLQQKTNSFLIAKTKNNNDDANFDDCSKYKDDVMDIIKRHNIKYFIDFHGLAQNRDCDINLGTHLGKNIETNIEAFNSLQNSLLVNFSVIVDQPFMAGSKTLSGSIKNEFEDIFTIQIEVNCGITNRKHNFKRFKLLAETLEKWIQQISKS